MSQFSRARDYLGGESMTQQPGAAPQYSPDGRHYWDGAQWLAVGPPPPPPTNGLPPAATALSKTSTGLNKSLPPWLGIPLLVVLVLIAGALALFVL